MKPKLNYHYTIPFKLIFNFDFKQYNDIVDETCYRDRVYPYLRNIIKNLNDKPNCRRQVIMTHNNKNDACLTSLQFQILNKKLIVIANFRSQCKINGRPYDTLMLQHIATKVLVELGLDEFKIFVNVGNYHINNYKA